LSKRREVSSVVAVTPDGRLFARHFRTSVSSRTVIQVLRYVRRQIGTPLLVVWDRLNAHRSRATTDFIAAHAQDYAVAYLPAYAPELNPEEQCNALVKRAMANALPQSVADLHRLARREFVRLQSRPKMITSFFHHAGLSVTGLPWRSLEPVRGKFESEQWRVSHWLASICGGADVDPREPRSLRSHRSALPE